VSRRIRSVFFRQLTQSCRRVEAFDQRVQHPSKDHDRAVGRLRSEAEFEVPILGKAQVLRGGHRQAGVQLRRDLLHDRDGFVPRSGEVGLQDVRHPVQRSPGVFKLHKKA